MRSTLGMITLLFSSLMLAASIPAVAENSSTSADDMHHHGHHHGHHEDHGATAEKPSPGTKWQTDAPLRQGMERIKDEFLVYAPAYHQGKLKPADAQKMSSQIREQVDFLIKNCKLEPKADASLHGLIAELLQAADALSKQPMSDAGMPRIKKVLTQYPDYFDHPGWQLAAEKE